MPSFNSKDGVWFPSHEEVVLTNMPPDKAIYKGPDRAALELLKELGVETLGVEFRRDPEIITRARQMGMTVDEWAKIHENPDKKREEDFKIKAAKPVTHTSPPRKEALVVPAGGSDTAGGGLDIYGGFGKEPQIK